MAEGRQNNKGLFYSVYSDVAQSVDNKAIETLTLCLVKLTLRIIILISNSLHTFAGPHV